MARRKPQIALLLDFDGTITKSDTTAIIGSRCLAEARELAPRHLPESRLPQSMDFYGQRYMQEYQAWKDSHQHSLSDCETVQQVVQYLSASQSIERNSFLRVRNAALDVSDEMNEFARHATKRNSFMMNCGRLAVRNGEVQIREPTTLRQLIDHTEQDDNFWGIISVSWSKRFILGALLEAGVIEERRAEEVTKKIRCNELLAPLRTDEHGQATIICTAQDKLDALDAFITELRFENPMVVVYVGDSSTDVGCLAEASVGFYLIEDSGTDNAAIRIAKQCEGRGEWTMERLTSDSLDNFTASQSHSGKPLHAIINVKSFGEIWAWISESSSSPR